MLKMNTLLILLTIFYLSWNKPIIMGFMVILQTLIYMSFIYLNFNLPWISLMLAMAFIGGILILFTYMISLNKSNKTKTKMDMKKIMWTILFSLLTFSSLIYKKNNLKFFSSQTNSILESFMIINLFSMSKMKMSLMMILFLFLAMLVILKTIWTKSSTFIN